MISFLGVHALLLGTCALLFELARHWSDLLSASGLAELGFEVSASWATVPVGRALVLPFAAFGLYKVMWQLRARYEFTPTGVTIETGVVWRRTGHCPLDELVAVDVDKGPFESLADAGQLTLHHRDGRRVAIPGVPDLGRVAVALRRTIELHHVDNGGMAWSAPSVAVTRRATGPWMEAAQPSVAGGVSFVAVLVALVAIPIGVAAWLDLPILHQVIDAVRGLQ